MEQQIHIHLHIGEGTHVNFADLFDRVDPPPARVSGSIAGSPDATGAAADTSAPAPAPVPAAATLYVVMYDSERQEFALGHRLYDTFDRAHDGNCHNGNFSAVSSITLDLANRRVVGTPPYRNRRYWAVIGTEGNFELGRNSFEDLPSLRSAYPDLFAVLVGSWDEDGNTALTGL